MYNANIPEDRELPSTSKLVKSTIIAAATALAILITVVLPAEYGIDPTGIGNALGLTRMGEIKMSLAKEAATDAEAPVKQAEKNPPEAASASVPAQPPSVATPTQPPASAEPAASIRIDEMQVTLAPNEGTEIKVAMAKGKKVAYSWTTNGGKANYDVHGDSKKLGIDYHGYEKGSEQARQGTIEAAFDGQHGWFWRNRTPETITVSLKTTGEYLSIEHMK